MILSTTKTCSRAFSRTTCIAGTAALPFGKTLANVNMAKSMAISVTTRFGHAGLSRGRTCATTTGKAAASTHLSRVERKDKQECGERGHNQRNISFLLRFGGGISAVECRVLMLHHRDNVSFRFVSFRFVSTHDFYAMIVSVKPNNKSSNHNNRQSYLP